MQQELKYIVIYSIIQTLALAGYGSRGVVKRSPSQLLTQLQYAIPNCKAPLLPVFRPYKDPGYFIRF